jgi:peptidoglycan hydrolase CwlO-like protein
MIKDQTTKLTEAEENNTTYTSKITSLEATIKQLNEHITQSEQDQFAL